jgi:hypothetical protein
MRVPVLPAAAFLALSIDAGIPPASPAQTAEGDRSRPVSMALDLGPMLTGTFEGTTPGNNMKAVLTVTGAVSPSDNYSLALRVTGKYSDAGVREQGLLNLQNAGRSIVLQYTPHFDPGVGMLSQDFLQFTPEEERSTCSFDVKPRGDGYVGETIGSSTCARAIRGAVGKWSFEVEPGTVRIRNNESGETLRFKRTAK